MHPRQSKIEHTLGRDEGIALGSSSSMNGHFVEYRYSAFKRSLPCEFSSGCPTLLVACVSVPEALNVRLCMTKSRMMRRPSSDALSARGAEFQDQFNSY